MNAAQLLDLDAEVVRRHAEAYEGFATAWEKRESSGNTAARGAGYWTIAGSYWGVLDIDRSQKCFARASELAEQEARSGFKERTETYGASISWRLRASLLALCARENQRASSLIREIGKVDQFSPTLIAVELLVKANEILLRGERSKQLGYLIELAASMPNVPVGQIRLPLAFFTRLAMLVSSGELGPADLLRWGEGFAGRLSEQVGLAQTSRYHWKRLYSSLLPLEPEALGAVLVWGRAIQASEGSVRELFNFKDERLAPMVAYLEASRDVWRREDPPTERNRSRGS
jgi:hypothetical protein